MKKSTLVTIVTIITAVIAVFTLVWVATALWVDLNGLAYKVEVSNAADLNNTIGNDGDAAQAARLGKQRSSFWALRLASRLTFWGRLMVSAGLALLTYLALRCLVRVLLALREHQHLRHQQR